MTAPKREPVVYEAELTSGPDGRYFDDGFAPPESWALKPGEPVRVRVTVEVVDCAPCGTCKGYGKNVQQAWEANRSYDEFMLSHGEPDDGFGPAPLDDCPACGGSGGQRIAYECHTEDAPCVTCGGSGSVKRRLRTHGHNMNYEAVCPTCGGTGQRK